MSKRQISDVEAFRDESEKARNIRPIQEEINRINDLIRDAEIEESENESGEAPAAAKDSNDSTPAQI